MINLCVYGVPPAPVYKGAGGGVRPARERGAGGVPLLPGVGLPPNPIPNRTLQREERREGGRPLLLVLIGLGKGGSAG